MPVLLMEVPPLTRSLKLDDPAPVVERAARLQRLRADLAHHVRFHLSGLLRFEHGLRVRVVPHVVPPVVPGGFVAVVMEHYWDDTVAVLGVEGDVVPGCVDGDGGGGVRGVGEGGLGAEEVGGEGAQVRVAVPAVEALDLGVQGLVKAHPAAVAFRVGGLEGDGGPVVEADGELEGFAGELLDGQVGPGGVEDVDDGVAFEDPVRVGEVGAEELAEFGDGVEEPGDVADPHHLALVFLLAEDHVEDGLVAVVVDFFAPAAAVVVGLGFVTELFHDGFGASE